MVKQVKKGKDGKRKETRAERQARLEGQREAREACQKLIPFAAGGIFVFLFLFAIYVRSLPPKVKKPRIVQSQQGVPEFMNVKTDPTLQGEESEKAALDEAMRLLKERESANPDENMGEPIVKIVDAETGEEMGESKDL